MNGSTLADITAASGDQATFGGYCGRKQATRMGDLRESGKLLHGGIKTDLLTPFRN